MTPLAYFAVASTLMTLPGLVLMLLGMLILWLTGQFDGEQGALWTFILTALGLSVGLLSMVGAISGHVEARRTRAELARFCGRLNLAILIALIVIAGAQYVLFLI